MSRFIHKQVTYLPPEQYAIVKSLHTFHIQNRKFIITKDATQKYVYSLNYNVVMNLYLMYKSREKEFGNGNYVSDKVKEHINLKKL